MSPGSRPSQGTCGASNQAAPIPAIAIPITTRIHPGCCTVHFFLGFWAFACCIFFRRWANLVAGFRGAWRWFLDMLVVLRFNSTVGGQGSVEWRHLGSLTRIR
jgi:hypothetical protein